MNIPTVIRGSLDAWLRWYIVPAPYQKCLTVFFHEYFCAYIVFTYSFKNPKVMLGLVSNLVG